MGRTQNYKTQNPYKLVATSRHAGPHRVHNRGERKRGGARNKMADYLEAAKDDWSKDDQEREDMQLIMDVMYPND